MYPFIPGSTHLIAGQSGSGKTHYLFKILKHKNVMFGEHPPTQIRYYYGIYQNIFSQMQEEIEGITFHENLPTEEEILSFTSADSHTLIILDDIQHLAANSDVIELIFTRISHHRFCSCFYILQNIFFQGKIKLLLL